MLKSPQLFSLGFHQTKFFEGGNLKEFILKQDWPGLDQKVKELTSPEGELYRFLQNYHDFKTIEFIISIRDSAHPWEEDGIWHDDGSRVFAFSLSLTLKAKNIEGGVLEIRKKNESFSNKIPTPEFGNIILFLTGEYGFEHKINRVTKGRRIIIAGWCS